MWQKYATYSLLKQIVKQAIYSRSDDIDSISSWEELSSHVTKGINIGSEGELGLFLQ